MANLEKRYKKYDQITHVRKKPGMYIGSVENVEKNMFILNDEKIINKKIIYNPGLYKLFDEILMNAYDETTRDKTLNIIKVSISNSEINIYNNGKAIPTTIHPKYKIHIPELIFGNLLTSSNYDDTEKRLTAGTHGLGAKLTAIFSNEFTIDIGDHPSDIQ